MTITTPYVTPSLLTTAQTGIAWGTIPARDATANAQLAAQKDLCLRSTGMVNRYVDQELRARLRTETVYGPDFRMTIEPNGAVRVILPARPIIKVTGGRATITSVFPRQWTEIAADQFDLEQPQTSANAGVEDLGGQAVLLAPGHITRALGRNGYGLQIDFVSGFPHTELTANAAVGATAVSVAELTGWTVGDVASLDQGGQPEEQATVAALSGTSGPGMVTLTAPLAAAWPTGALFTALPAPVTQAAILYATAQALTRSASVTTVQSAGTGSSRTGRAASPLDLQKIAEQYLRPYRRVF